MKKAIRLLVAALLLATFTPNTIALADGVPWSCGGGGNCK